MIDFNRDNYLTEQRYILSSIITEYDISKANINILYYKGGINKDEYNYANSLCRQDRQIYIGLKQKNHRIAQLLKEGFAEFRKAFILSNGFSEADIVSIKKDAIFVLNKKASITQFDNIHFIEKNVYNSYMNINRLEIYYGSNPVNDIETIDIKGISDENLKLHEDYMVALICTVLDCIQCGTIKEVYDVLMKIQKMYIDKKLPIGFYREFNPDSMYRISMRGTQYLMPEVMDNEKQFLNIACNYNIIQEIFKLISVIYFNAQVAY